ncbi:MAG: dihydrolipoyl dehydrogenase [Malacoplasma sp.]|nr:dihydrolipoyl dehydrogenase [Malacoplasma sp.]
MKKYDVIVIGSGPGGYIAGEYAAKHQLKTLVIENEEFGGVCLNKGCIPTKTLLRSAKIHEYIEKSVYYGIDGIDFSKLTLNWQRIQERKNEVIHQLRMGVQGILRAAKADVIKGTASVIDASTIEVNGERIEYQNLIVATGSRPRLFPLPGFAEGYANKTVVTSDEVLSLKEIPKKFTVIGGGVIGVEFAVLYAGLGSKVTIVQGVDRILEILDKDISAEITKLLKNSGVDIVTNAKVLEYKNNSVYFELDGKTTSFEGDITLVSVGRAPNSDIVKHLVDIAPNGSIISNSQMQTSVKNIYAIGDCTSKIMLAHSAYKNAIVAVDSILGVKSSFDPNKVPSCIYTHPEVASIGKTEEELIASSISFYKASVPMKHIGKSLADGQTVGFIKMLVSQDHGQILGCHIVGSNASDMISEVALAMELEATVYDIATTIHPHPTVSEAIWEVAKKIVLDNFLNKKWYNQ